MSGRLASFKGPSTPTSSPARAQQPPPSPARSTGESTFHRKVRLLLQELRSLSETWDDLLLLDGLKQARLLVDTRTDLDNALASLPDRRPRRYLVGSQLAVMDNCIASLDSMIQKLEKVFKRMNAAVDNLELVLIEAHKTKGWQWVQDEPLWVSWPLEKFITSIPAILGPYHRSLTTHKAFVEALRSHSTPFADSKAIIEKWAEQGDLVESSWDDSWEDLCSVEIDRWNKT